MFNKSKPPAPPKAQPTRAAVPVPDDLPDLRRAAPTGPTASTPTSAPPTPTVSRNPSVLAADLTFEGNVSGAGDLQIDGTVKGDVRVARLIVGETGAVEGSVQGDTIEVRGRVVGAVNAKNVKLLGTAFVDGDISHEQLSIDVGAYFQGRAMQARGNQPATAAPATPPSSGFGSAPVADPADGAQLIELKPTA